MEINGLRFEFSNESNLPNRANYCFYTKVMDPKYWITKIKMKRITTVDLGSTTNNDSRIMKIWRATCKVAKEHGNRSFIRKHVEDIEQTACGNNRQPSRSAFLIFAHLGWLKVIREDGDIKYYKLSSNGPKYH